MKAIPKSQMLESVTGRAWSDEEIAQKNADIRQVLEQDNPRTKGPIDMMIGPGVRSNTLRASDLKLEYNEK